MPTPSQSAQFTKVLCADFSATLQDISPYMRSASLPQDNMDTNLTAFATGGGPVTETHQKGARIAVPALQVLGDPTLLYILNQIHGSLTGNLWQFFQGNNAAPAAADLMYQGTFTLFGINATYNVGQEWVMALNLQITDGGAVLPGWYPA